MTVCLCPDSERVSPGEKRKMRCNCQ
uniref:Uncharacterized protein n=1 Tax=Rhizophora mucronata TaxID=61149 RepID=A0A2P2R063_RHIMU